jgi:peptide/nickel transport system permease protein
VPVTFYIIRRLFIGALLILFMSLIFFALTRLTPGPPITTGENPKANEALVQARLHRLGLDQPWYAQYPNYLGALVRGDMGDSYTNHKAVTTLLLERVPNSILLYGVATLVAIVIGVPLGVFAATRQYSKVDMATSVVSYVGFSMPSFILGIALLLFFGVWFHQTFGFGLPLAGMHSGGEDSIPDLLVHMIMPVTSLAILSIAYFSRFMRASLLEVMHQDYIRTARAKGLPSIKVNYKHALRNAVIPLITVIALTAPVIVAGAIITEGIFSWPGIGLLAYEASVTRDYPVIMGVIMMVAVTTVFFNLVADIAYAAVDPRIRY